MAADLDAFDTSHFAALRQQQRIATVAHEHCVHGAALEFVSLEVARGYALYAMASIAVGQVLARVRAFLGARDLALEAGSKE